MSGVAPLKCRLMLCLGSQMRRFFLKQKIKKHNKIKLKLNTHKKCKETLILVLLTEWNRTNIKHTFTIYNISKRNLGKHYNWRALRFSKNFREIYDFFGTLYLKNSCLTMMVANNL